VPDRPSSQCVLIAFQKSHFIISNVAKWVFRGALLFSTPSINPIEVRFFA